jgi:hypothetical protein
MRVVTYALQFHRPAKGSGGSEQPTLAPGLRVTTLVEHGTLSSQLERLSGDRAVVHLSYTLNHDKTLFFESGTIVFGSEPGASTLEFSSVGAGTLLGPPGPDGFTHGVVVWKIDRGTGALSDATGAISSNFLVNLETDELIDSHLGVVHLPDASEGLG